jgi:ubiquinone/menaquinone biosynthesis C-methylase UbiE
MPKPAGDVAAHFHARAAGYAKHQNWVNDEPSLMPILGLIAQQPGGILLEIGAGTGAVARMCARSAPEIGTYIGIDLSHSMLLQHAAHAPAVVGDAHLLPLAAKSANTVICRQSIHYFERPEVALAEIGRVLAPHGRLLIAQIVPFDDEDDQTWWRKAVALRQPLRRHNWTRAGLEEALRRAGFVIESVQHLQRRTSLKGWLDRYSLDPAARQALIEHFDTAPASVRERRGFVVTTDDIEYSLQWVFITAALGDDAARAVRLPGGARG